MTVNLPQLVHPSWLRALEPHLEDLERISQFLLQSPTGFLPAGEKVLRAFSMPLDQVRVLIVGQDPYPTPGHPVGLSFSVERSVQPVPRSLQNIYAELHSDLGIAPPQHGDLTGWFHQGVLLLNRVLTVAPGQPASHRNIGWEAITESAINALAQRGGALVAVLWGAQAQTLAPSLTAAGVSILTSPHPSPLSAHRGFFGSRPFSRTNELLVRQEAAPVDWGRL